ncbi:MAG: glycosyltransferase family 4 protein, partial [Acidobacteriota bacterium]|nr:glycosyltransferase family 4 protein [Acidobacteriota bacterium]
MNRLRVLITTYNLSVRGGTQMHARDMALGLLERGHTPIVYSTQLGDAAREIRDKTVVVTDNLNTVSVAPDIIHGNHHLEAVTAMLHFPGVPAVHTVHGNLGFLSAAPKFSRILRYLPVDYTCCDRLIYEYGIPEDRICVILNSVDLKRFTPRRALPALPKRALVFSNYAGSHLKAIREACARHGLSLDCIGADTNACAEPEKVLGKYDIVFAKARCALEAMAVGAAVILCDYQGLGPMVTSSELDRLRAMNFGHRALRKEINADLVAGEIARYDATDAAEISRRIRATAGLDKMVNETIREYHEVLAEYKAAVGPDLEAEEREAASYIRWLSTQIYTNPSGRASLKTILSRIPVLNSPQVADFILNLATKVATTRKRSNGAHKGR